MKRSFKVKEKVFQYKIIKENLENSINRMIIIMGLSVTIKRRKVFRFRC